MVKKFLLISLVFFGGILYSEETSQLTFYKETEHFQAYCLKRDVAVTETVLHDLEEYYRECSRDFHYLPSSSEKIRFYLYPDIDTFHSLVYHHSLPQWEVTNCSAKTNNFYLVNPKNHGTIHTEETVMKCAKACLGDFIIDKKYGSASELWLREGLNLYKAKLYSKETRRQYLLNSNGQIEMPSLNKLLKNDHTDRRFYAACCMYAEFLVNEWGWDKALALLENYSAFESILQISQKKFQEMGVQYCQKILSSD